MKYFILKVKLNGVKNIKDEIEMNFYKNKLDKQIEYEKSNIKSIYGPNGAGKTAIMYALNMYKKITIDPNYISFANSVNIFTDFINTETKEFSIEVFFAKIDFDNTVQSVYSHKIVLKEQNNNYVLVEDTLKELKGLIINKYENYKIIYSVKNGIHERFKHDEYLDSNFETSIKNISFTQAVAVIVFKDKNITNNFPEFYSKIIDIISFANNLVIVLQKDDIEHTNLNRINLLFDSMEKGNKEKFSESLINRLSTKRISNERTYLINKEDKLDYLKLIKKMASFIKIIKKELIEIDVKENEKLNYIEFQNTLVYKNNIRVSEKLESTGIKKLIEIYFALCSLEKGKIVLIDEFDANIHDVLLCKIIEYVANFTTGQFIFTTHNVSPMDLLQKTNFSIDFLSSDSKITQWKKNGNYSASSLYKKGKIEYSPFNIESIDFLGVFNND